ncbi:MAG: IPT/TIG domain-containing protein, partial [Planctomycetota bacterium]
MTTILRLGLACFALLACSACSGDGDTINTSTTVAGLPQVAGVTPSAGPPGGGQLVTLTGIGFVPGATVAFGGTPASLVSVLSDTQATAVTPARPIGVVSVTLTNPTGASGSVGGYRYQLNAAPTISTNPGGPIEVLIGAELTLHVTATDPEGGPVTLRLLNPPAGGTFDPVSSTSPATGTLRWRVPYNWGGLNQLYFQAVDGGGLRTTVAVDVRGIGSPIRRAILHADVTGDGVLDVVAGAQNADVGGTVNTGAIYVWAGTSSPTGAPTATLTVTGAVASDFLTNATGQGIQCCDVTGDGVLDVVAGAQNADVGGTVDTGAIYVWAGTSSPTGAPTATLTVTGAVASDRLGLAAGQGIQ